MKWRAENFLMYEQAKEYVDTALIPLIPLKWGEEEKQTIIKGEYTSYLAEYLETQFTGRVFLMPSFTYLTIEQTEDKLRRLKQWDKHLVDNGFKHIIYITADITWRTIAPQLPDELIWTPVSTVESMDKTQFRATIEQQAKELMPIFTTKWQEEPKSRGE
ncbi:YpiF family protein [Salipaludibacillus agaradhaerens]|jgi:hypothetical protein|uniref:YpiF family protein n=1 Tax=Salipaludibacillus agaradhaerens TaxID=76935 RepID=A0A9Q4B192_SALAG|nr:YpiF family protein [Salipaludibacillus agaradhaerens]MCR6096501.1 YpiF family protein [Salipaludibacillus agaradhaerens]MCR6113940.1 YpiF family protein [Salipaludibacillus agaradhaerens]